MKSILARNLRKIREDNEMSQGELAFRVGIHKNTIKNYESDTPDKPDIYLLSKIAKLYSVKLDDLVSDLPSPFNDEIYTDVFKESLRLPEKDKRKILEYIGFQIDKNKDRMKSQFYDLVNA